MLKRVLILSVAAVFALSVRTAGQTAPAAPQGAIIQKVIVRVNGEIFTQTELEFRQIETLKEQNPKIRTTLDITTDPGLRAALALVTGGLLVDAVDELLWVQHGHEIGAKFTEATFQTALEGLKKQNNISDDKTFAAALKEFGVTMADLRVNIERTYIIQQVQQHELTRNMTLTREEARKYYDTHPTEFMKPSTVTIREILVTVPTETVGGQASFSVGADEAAKQKITTIRERAIKGEDFVKLVAEASDSGTKANGGLIGPVALTDLSPAMSQLLEKLKPGEMSEPIRARTGYQLIKLETRSTSELEDFEKSRELISQKILESRFDVEKSKFTAKLLAQAVIEWKDESYRKLYEAERATRTKTMAPGAGK